MILYRGPEVSGEVLDDPGGLASAQHARGPGRSALPYPVIGRAW